MLCSATKLRLGQQRRNPGLSRWFQTSTVPAAGSAAARKKEYTEESTTNPQTYVKRNELGVQLLSRRLHSQIFKNVSFPAPDPTFTRISKQHLDLHGLDPTQGSVLPDTAFTLPPLQGSTLLEHFHRIGAHAAEPYLSISKSFSQEQLPPKPDDWHIQSGWTKYYHLPDGSSYSEHVDFPMHNGLPEQILTFDVETMPKYSPFAVMACAVSANAWYAWISPWLLGESSEAAQLIPLGDPTQPRVVVGHNVSYDRGRLLEEYSLKGTKTRFIDTMALHVAVKGISSHQRPAWMKYRKNKEVAKEQRNEAVEAVVELMADVELRHSQEDDLTKKEELRRLRQEMEESLPMLNSLDRDEAEEAEMEASSKRWEDITSANSLADVAKLHCGISMDKQVRNDFMTAAPEEIRENITDYLAYCAHDVFVTHSVFTKVLPEFLVACPHPVSFAGILTMGSSFLTVNEEWEHYLDMAEGVYREMEQGVKNKLKLLAEAAREMDEFKWKEDPWLNQLDWTPKVAGKSRGIYPIEVESAPEPEPEPETVASISSKKRKSAPPIWYEQLVEEPFSEKSIQRIIPHLFKFSYDGHPMRYSPKECWHYVVDDNVLRVETSKSTRTTTILSKKHCPPNIESGRLQTDHQDLALDIAIGDRSTKVEKKIINLAKLVLKESRDEDPWLSQLDWNSSEPEPEFVDILKKRTKAKAKIVKPEPTIWPKWYWEATKPKKDHPPGTLDITVRNRIAPILLRLSWLGWPLFHSREHGWTFRVPSHAQFQTRLNPLSFYDPNDYALGESALRGGYLYYKLPHKDGEKANVGSPLSKTFMKFAQDGTLKSPGDEAKEALDMNSQCSYWISARDRIMNQVVLWQKESNSMGFDVPLAVPEGERKKKWGIILPQMITMGTVTRRAIEKTWLTASNAKKNRVGSELKAMVRAPEGYAIVGADVDSEELWISSCMGDAQFGLHGATAIGWMTLEGTKAAGTDLHSKTANILGISRDQAKVFNYSRIYGAGMRHAVLLLLQSNAGMLPEQAQKLAENLYASTKGKNTHRNDIFGRKFWFGGTESYLFNKLEDIALSDKPQTPALGCGVTYALSKEYLPEGFGSDYMPSRINWVVQSSGVDYLHLLIVSMDHLITKYNIDARYLISVHDELRYLVKEEDRYRAALALQIANMWTRSMFAYKLGMDDLPQGVAFFSAVDIDKVLRKEVDMTCVTPSQPIPIPPGESMDITAVLAKTNGGSLWKDGRPMSDDEGVEYEGSLDGFKETDCLVHRAESAAFLLAQATQDFNEVKHHASSVSGQKFYGGIGGGKKQQRDRKPRAPIGADDNNLDWL